MGKIFLVAPCPTIGLGKLGGYDGDTNRLNALTGEATGSEVPGGIVLISRHARPFSSGNDRSDWR